MYGKLFLWIVLAVLCSTIIRFLLMLDLNKRVYNHVPGPCRIVEGPTNGAEDIELLGDGTAFITSGLIYLNEQHRSQVQGRIFLYDFNSKEPIYKAVQLKIEGANFDKKSFSPHGLSSYVSKGRVTLYVINHPTPEESTVECFLFNKEKKSLTHTKTIRDALIYNGNDLKVVGADRFFISNDHYFTKKWMIQFIEGLFMLNLGSLVYYDGKQGNVVDSWLSGPNGVAVDTKNKHLYVSLVGQEAIRVYNLSADMKIVKHLDMNLMTMVDNLFVEPKTGDIWTGAHMVVHEVLRHLDDPKKHTAPSQVLRVRIQDGHNSWVVTEPYANDGKMLSGSSVAVFYEGKLLIGTVHHKLMLCDILNPDYA